jgi:hypothetical protein
VVNIDVNSLKSVTQLYSLYPTPDQLCLASTHCANDNDNITIIASNCTTSGEHHANAMQIASMHVVADTGATSVFVMAGKKHSGGNKTNTNQPPRWKKDSINTHM